MKLILESTILHAGTMQLICWACFANVSKIVCSSTRINTFTLPLCTMPLNMFCNHSLTTTAFGYPQPIKPVWPINLNHLQMQTFDQNSAPLNFFGILFVLATTGKVSLMFRNHAFHSVGLCTEQTFISVGTGPKFNFFFFFLLLL